MQVTADAFTQIQNSPNYEDGQRFLERKANGNPCINEVDDGFLNWIEQTVTLCTLDPDLISMVTGDPVITDNGESVGVAIGEGILNSRFSTEVWQEVTGDEACDPEGQQRFVYWAFPHQGDAQIQDFTFENAAFTLAFRNRTKKASTLWDIGDPWLADTPASEWDNQRHFALAITSVPPPEAACGAVQINGS
jgi:hypothetical protein